MNERGTCWHLAKVPGNSTFSFLSLDIVIPTHTYAQAYASTHLTWQEHTVFPESVGDLGPCEKFGSGRRMEAWGIPILESR